METVETLNTRLVDYFGYFVGNKPNYRIVFSDEQKEKRLTDLTREGFKLQKPTILEMPKYSYIKGKYLLEKLIEVPPQNLHELTELLSYECIWVFEDRNGFPLPPVWNAIEIIVKTLHDNMGQKKKYHDPESSLEESLESKEKRVKQLEEDLFGNESEICDALRYQQGIVVPHNYNKVN